MKVHVYNNDVSKAYRILRLARKRGIARFKKQEKKRLIAQEKAEIRLFKRNRQLSQQNKARHQSSPSKYNKNLKHP